MRKQKSSDRATPSEPVHLEAENCRLCADLAEARWTMKILTKAFFWGGVRPPVKVIVDLIDDRDEFRVEPIVRVLKGTAASSYYVLKKRMPSACAVRDQELLVVIRDVMRSTIPATWFRRCGRRSIVSMLGGSGRSLRVRLEWLMRQLGIDGVLQKRKHLKTASARVEECLGDFVERKFTASGRRCSTLHSV